MPRDSNGNASTDPVYIAVPGTTIRAVQHNTPIADIIQMLTGSLARNGTGGMLADLPMGGFKITGLADGVNPQDAATKAQLDANAAALPVLGAWTNVASASTVDLGAQTSRNIVITGTTTITSFGTAGAADNVPYLLRFSGALTLTNGANLILPGGANIVTAVGDIAIVIHDDADIWRIAFYSRAAMRPLIAGTSANNLVALDTNGKLPAVPGDQLTGLGRRFATQQTLTGLTSIDFAGIPDGVDKVVLGLFGAAAPGGVLRVRLGNQSGILKSGYVGSISSRAGEVTVTDSFGLSISTSNYCDGIVTFERLNGNMWGYSTVLGSSVSQNGGGIVDLLATPLRTVRLFGTTAFNSGVATLAWG